MGHLPAEEFKFQFDAVTCSFGFVKILACVLGQFFSGMRSLEAKEIFSY